MEDLHVFGFILRNLDKEKELSSQIPDLVSVCDGKATTIVATIKAVLHKKGTPNEQL